MLVKTKSRMIIATAAILLSILVAIPARAADSVIGYLSCNEASGWGFIIGSSHDIKCIFTSNNHRTERYTGNIAKFGADIGYLQSVCITLWAVAAPTTDLNAGALAGDYGGAQASLALGVGGGLNVLLGGFHNSIELQPVSVEGHYGLNVAAGIERMSLHYEGLEAPR